MKYGNLFLFAIPPTLTTGHFCEYFIQHSQKLFIFLMPLTNQDPIVKLLMYEKGTYTEERVFHLYRGGNILLRYLFFYLYYLYSIFFILPRRTTIIATTPQYLIGNSIFYLLKHITVVYHVGDYYPGKKGIMQLYQLLIHFYNQTLKYVIYCSPTLEKILRTGKEKKDGNRDYWVFGIKNRGITRKPTKNLLGYIGVLRHGQGLDILFESLQKDKKLLLEIMGDGPLRAELEQMVINLKLTSRVTFLGLIQDERKIQSLLQRWSIGLAPYEPSTSNMTYFGDPSKIKFYLEYKLPVIMTDITYMAEELKTYHAGECIEYNADSLLRAIHTITNNYNQYVQGVERLINKYEYSKYYSEKFTFLTTI